MVGNSSPAFKAGTVYVQGLRFGSSRGFIAALRREGSMSAYRDQEPTETEQETIARLTGELERELHVTRRIVLALGIGIAISLLMALGASRIDFHDGPTTTPPPSLEIGKPGEVRTLVWREDLGAWFDITSRVWR